MSASDEQIQQLENICAEYGYRVPKVYLDYLKAMGESDGGLLLLRREFLKILISESI